MPLNEAQRSGIKEKRMMLLRVLERDLPDFYFHVAEEITSKGEQEKLIGEYKKIHLEATELCQIILPLEKGEETELKRLRERVRCLMEPIYALGN